jgi:hypothetical protein
MHADPSTWKVRRGGGGGPAHLSPNQKRHDRRKVKCWKARKEHRWMVVGDDKGIGEISSMVGKIVIGRFCGKFVIPTAIKKWLNINWKPFLGYSPFFHTLARGWICFVFKSHEDVMEVFDISSWSYK